MRLKDKKILLGLTGSIAIYKSASILRRLVNDEGADVEVVMTESALEFMTPLIFETFSGKKVLTEMFPGGLVSTRHIDLADKSDLVLVCPATANIIAKAASGICDDLLSTIIVAAGCKTVFAPAMNSSMYLNPVTQENIKKLQGLGYRFIEPEEGQLACGYIGPGRLAEEKVIISYIDALLNRKDLLKDKKVIVTAGPTREYIDPIRFISNRSSGKMGYAIAEEVVKEGGNVLIISGPTNIDCPYGAKLIKVETAKEMEAALIENSEGTDFLFMAAAVEDICPSECKKSKIKKSDFINHIDVVKSPDLILSFRKANPNSCVVGFSVEMGDGRAESIEKMKAKKMDFIVWNDPSKEFVGFESNKNEVTLFSSDGKEWFFPIDSKRKIAESIVRVVVENWH